MLIIGYAIGRCLLAITGDAPRAQDPQPRTGKTPDACGADGIAANDKCRRRFIRSPDGGVVSLFNQVVHFKHRVCCICRLEVERHPSTESAISVAPGDHITDADRLPSIHLAAFGHLGLPRKTSKVLKANPPPQAQSRGSLSEHTSWRTCQFEVSGLQSRNTLNRFRPVVYRTT